MSRLKRQKESSTPRLVANMQAYYPWVRCLEAPIHHPEWENCEWLRLDHWRPSDATNQRAVQQMAADTAREIEATEAGQWCGVLRPSGQSPGPEESIWREAARKRIEAHCLNGPDGPGKRWLTRCGKQKMIPFLAKQLAAPASEPPRLPMRAELDKITTTPPKFTDEPRRFDPENDPELQGDLPWETG